MLLNANRTRIKEREKKNICKGNRRRITWTKAVRGNSRRGGQRRRHTLLEARRKIGRDVEVRDGKGFREE